VPRLIVNSDSAYNRPPEYRSTYMPSPASPANMNSLALSTITPSESASHSESLTLVTRPAINERLTIPTKNESLSSGFPYDSRVYDLISHDEWHLLSQDILGAAKLTIGEDFVAWTTGITAGTLATPLVLVLGPFAGYYAGRAVHRKTVVKAVKERLDRNGEIRAVLRRWNETTFKGRGFEAWLELPVDGGEVKLDSISGKKPKQSKKERKIASKIARRFKIVIVPTSGSKGQEICKP
jgi:hypothetical protein